MKIKTKEKIFFGLLGLVMIGVVYFPFWYFGDFPNDEYKQCTRKTDDFIKENCEIECEKYMLCFERNDGLMECTEDIPVDSNLCMLDYKNKYGIISCFSSKENMEDNRYYLGTCFEWRYKFA